MTSKHHQWQARWALHPQQQMAEHDSGLQVRLQGSAGVALNAEAAVAALQPLHGAHNAEAMVKRLVREGAQLLIDPSSRGWRG